MFLNIDIINFNYRDILTLLEMNSVTLNGLTSLDLETIIVIICAEEDGIYAIALN